MKLGLIAAALVACLLCAACPLHNPPPCDPSQGWPEPCAQPRALDGGANATKGP